MNTPQAQIKLNIPLPMKDYVESKAIKFGLPLAAYIRHLILKDIENTEYPTYRASEETENAYKKAMDEFKRGKKNKEP